MTNEIYQIWICPIENVWFCFISIVWVHFSHKTEKFWFWKSLKYFNILKKKDMTSDLNMTHRKMSDFVSLPLVGFALVTKLKNVDFESHWITLIFFIKICQISILPVKQCLIWFKLCCVSRILVISWEIQILNFTEIV